MTTITWPNSIKRCPKCGSFMMRMILECLGLSVYLECACENCAEHFLIDSEGNKYKVRSE